MTLPRPEIPEIAVVMEHYGVECGSRRIVLCPVHPDHTPSCSVNHARNLWNCHSCGEGGDSWSLIMKKEGIPPEQFGRAIDYAAAHNFSDGATGRRDKPVSGSRYGSRSKVSDGSRDQSGDRGWVPSWRRQ